MQELRQSTAINIMLGVFVDSADGASTEEALTLAQADLQLSKNGAAAAQKNDATSATHRYGGDYSVPLNATDTDTLGCLELMCKESGALPVKKSFMVVTANYWDSKYSTDKLQVDVTQLLGTAWLTPGTAGTPDVNAKQIGGTVQTGRDIGTSVLLSSGSGTGQLDITSGVVKSNLAQILGTALTETAGYIAAGFKKLFNVATPLLVASEVMRGTDSAALNTGVQLSAQGKLDVNAECDSALSDYGANTTTPPTAGANADAVWDEILTGASHNDATSAGRRLRQSADVLIAREGMCQAGGANNEVILDTGASTVDDFYLHDIVILTSGTGAGESRHIDSYVGATKTATVNRNWTTNPDATTDYTVRFDSAKHVHGFETEAKNEINAECDTALTDYGANTTVPDAAGVAATPAEVATALTNIHLDHLFAADYDPASKPGVGTALLNELVEDDAGVSRFTENALEQAPSGTGASAATIADAVWDEAIADHTVGTSFGAKNQKVVPSETIDDYKATGFNTVIPDAAGVAPTVGEIRTEMEGAGTKLALVLEDTNELQTNQGGWATATGFSTHNAANVRTEMDSNSTKMTSIEGDTQDIQSRLPAALSGGNMKADALAISTSTDAADKLEASAETIVTGAAVTGTLSTTEMTTNLTEATDDHFNGRIIIWTSGVLKDQATNATDYDGAAKKLIYTATTEAPSDGDAFVLV